MADRRPLCASEMPTTSTRLMRSELQQQCQLQSVVVSPTHGPFSRGAAETETSSSKCLSLARGCLSASGFKLVTGSRSFTAVASCELDCATNCPAVTPLEKPQAPSPQHPARAPTGPLSKHIPTWHNPPAYRLWPPACAKAKGMEVRGWKAHSRDQSADAQWQQM